MARDRHVPTAEGLIGSLEKRIGILERRLGQLIDARRTPLLFSFAGIVADAIGTESPPLRTIHPTEIDLIVPQVRVAPSGADITIDLTLYGPTTGVVRTVTIADGLLYVEDAVPFIIPMGGAVTATVTAADSGTAMDLAVHLIPKLL